MSSIRGIRRVNHQSGVGHSAHLPSCYNFLYGHFQGRTFGAPGLTALAVSSQDRREQSRRRAARVTRRRRPGSPGGLAVAGRQLSPRPSDASPTARRLPRAATPVTDRCGPRRTPLPRPPAPRPGRQHRAGCADRREDVTITGPERRALSGSAPPASKAPALERRRPLPTQRA
jgi:hypothetical protein